MCVVSGVEAAVRCMSVDMSAKTAEVALERQRKACLSLILALVIDLQ